MVEPPEALVQIITQNTKRLPSVAPSPPPPPQGVHWGEGQTPKIKNGMVKPPRSLGADHQEQKQEWHGAAPPVLGVKDKSPK